MADTPKSDADERQVEELARELARRLRGMNSRQELTDYAVAMLRESAEEANQEEQARGRGHAIKLLAQPGDGSERNFAILSVFP